MSDSDAGPSLSFCGIWLLTSFERSKPLPSGPCRRALRFLEVGPGGNFLDSRETIWLAMPRLREACARDGNG